MVNLLEVQGTYDGPNSIWALSRVRADSADFHGSRSRGFQWVYWLQKPPKECPYEERALQTARSARYWISMVCMGVKKMQKPDEPIHRGNCWYEM